MDVRWLTHLIALLVTLMLPNTMLQVEAAVMTRSSSPIMSNHTTIVFPSAAYSTRLQTTDTSLNTTTSQPPLCDWHLEHEPLAMAIFAGLVCGYAIAMLTSAIYRSIQHRRLLKAIE